MVFEQWLRTEIRNIFNISKLPLLELQIEATLEDCTVTTPMCVIDVDENLDDWYNNEIKPLLLENLHYNPVKVQLHVLGDDYEDEDDDDDDHNEKKSNH